MTIPFVDLKALHADLQGQVLSAIEAVVKSNHFINGPDVKAFEAEFAAFLNVPHAVGVSSGSDALVAALHACDIGRGDEVITSPFTFFATVEAILRVGATPRFADIDPESFNLDPVAVSGAITPRTKAVIAVHLYGRSADMGALVRLAKSHGIALIEDAAQSVGAEWEGSRVGGLGDIGCFSFFPAKNLGAFGDGGAVTTRQPALWERLMLVRAHGSPRRYQHSIMGGNYRLDSIQAAVLRVKLPFLEGWTADRQDAAIRYGELFGQSGLAGQITLPSNGPGRHVFNQYVIRVHDGRRDELFDALGAKGIGRAVYYPLPCHQQPLIMDLGFGGDAMPEAERAAQECLALPIAPGLQADQQVEVVAAIRETLCA